MAFFAAVTVAYVFRFATYDSLGPVVSALEAVAASAVLPSGAAEAATEGRKASEAVSADRNGESTPTGRIPDEPWVLHIILEKTARPWSRRTGS